MISFIGNRPAIQIGRHQVFDYDTAWLDDALIRAARAADQNDFPFVTEIRSGIVEYLEHACKLRLLHLHELFEKVRKMLVKIGCGHIAEHLRPIAPPLTISLVHAAMEAGSGYELAFFEKLRSELEELRSHGAGEIRFTGVRECVLILRSAKKWDKRCETVFQEIEAFLKSWDSLIA
ncbi:MAG TPA: hypothetical protein VM511_03925 [Luteolibacter sp.]|nr:hypothetical protein [Luteolibacter sp.]